MEDKPFAMRYETRKVIEMMKDGVPGESSLTREQITKEIGVACSPDDRGYGYVQSAIRHVLNGYHKVWKWSRHKQAYFCLKADEIVGDVKLDHKSVTRRMKRTITKLESVDTEKLDASDREQYQLQAQQSQLALMSLSEPLRKRLKQKDVPKLKTPTYDQMAEFFA